MVGRDLGGGDEVDTAVLEHLFLAGRDAGRWELLGEAGRFGPVVVVYPLQLAAGLAEPVAHPVDVPMVEPDRGEHELALLTDPRRRAPGRVVHTVAVLHGRAPPAARRPADLALSGV